MLCKYFDLESCGNRSSNKFRMSGSNVVFVVFQKRLKITVKNGFLS